MDPTAPNPEPRIELVDTHCHPYLMDGEVSTIFESARALGVTSFVCVGVDPESNRSCLEYAREYEGVVATAGLHPHEADSLDPQVRVSLESMISDPLVVGVGEAGLDFFRMHSPVEEQEAAFRWQLSLARESGKPIVVHIRDAWERGLQILAEEPMAKVVLHCFSGDALIARECAARGYFLSFAGPITYPKNGHLREAAASVPLELLLSETDSPYLSPQSSRGKENTPANVAAVVEAFASVRGETLELIARSVARNAARAFSGLR